MSKVMKFRNSGKLDLSGKNMEYILAGVLGVIIVVAVVFAVAPMRCDSGASGPMGEPKVKCVECNEEWEIDPKDQMRFGRETERIGAPLGEDCDKCGKKECVFLMTICPNCKKYFLSKRITDPEEFAESGRKEICPHCNTDLHKWYKEHRRR